MTSQFAQVGVEYPTVSVVVLAYNAERYIREAVESVLRQDYPGDIELVICYDKGSRDKTLEVISEFKSAENRHVKIYRHEHTTLFRARVECGLKNSSGDYITFLDYDNFYPKDYISKVMSHIKGKDASFIFTKAQLVDADGRPLGRFLVEPPERPSTESLLLGNYIDINTIILRKDCKNKILEIINNNINHPYFDWVFDDWLFGLLGLKYCKPMYIYNVFINYRIHEYNITYQSREDNIKSLFNSERSIKTLIAFYILNNNKINKKEFSNLTKSLISYYYGYFYIITKRILKISKIEFFNLVIHLMGNYIYKRVFKRHKGT